MSPITALQDASSTVEDNRWVFSSKVALDGLHQAPPPKGCKCSTANWEQIFKMRACGEHFSFELLLSWPHLQTLTCLGSDLTTKSDLEFYMKR